MNADRFLESLRPYLSRRQPELAIEEIDSFLSALDRFKDNPEIGPVDRERIKQARARIAGGKGL
jgi:plasmid stabilization system protein ParE